jgi:AMMECR1 domain-containing protein
MLSLPVTNQLLWLARESIEYFLDTKSNYPYEKISIPAEMRNLLDEKLPLFVTIKKKSEIRGRSGVFESSEEIGRLVCQLAVNAAFFDTRTPRLKPYELNEISIQLLFPQKMTKLSDKKADAIAAFGATKKGVYIAARGRFAYALPDQWNDIPEPDIMIRMLLMQLGITRKNSDVPVDYYAFECDESIETILSAET